MRAEIYLSPDIWELVMILNHNYMKLMIVCQYNSTWNKNLTLGSSPNKSFTTAIIVSDFSKTSCNCNIGKNIKLTFSWRYTKCIIYLANSQSHKNQSIWLKESILMIGNTKFSSNQHLIHVNFRDYMRNLVCF